MRRTVPLESHSKLTIPLVYHLKVLNYFNSCFLELILARLVVDEA